MIGKRKNEALRLKYEKAFFRPVKKAVKSQISSFTDDIKASGVQYAISRMNTQLWNEQIAPVIVRLHAFVGVAKANQVLDDLSKAKLVEKRSGFGYNAEWTRQITQYFADHLFDKIVLPISETTRDYIMAVIKRGIRDGWSVEEIVQKIEREDYLDGRVRRIIRTEAGRAINYGAQMGGEKYRYQTQKRWVAVHDERTRHSHLAADGQQVGWESGFAVGGEVLSFPGDPNGKPGNTINCRCYTEVVPIRDESGRLLPKENRTPVRVRGRLRDQLQDILNDLQ